MKVSKATGAQHREALLVAASRLFRDKGFDKVGIAEIAAAADLTHGAFYSHFASKEALCAEVVERAIGRTAELLQGSGNRRAYIEGYLSPKHVRNRGEGCPFAALGADAARESPAIKAAFSQSLDRFLDVLAEALPDRPTPARDRAIVSMATLVGGLLLARTAADAKLRDEILKAVKGELLAGRPAN
jgi:TetR/AcrR family transcriptional repressor of nem operon